MGKSSAPAGPDYNALADKQNAANSQSFQTQLSANRPQVNTPGSTVSWQQTKTGSDFNANDYLAANPDVAAALQNGSADTKSAWDHYQKYGKNEGRKINAAGDLGTGLDANGMAPTKWTENTSLAPQLQSAFDSTTSQLAKNLSKPQDFYSMLGDSGIQQKAQDALYNRQTQYLDPQFKQSDHDVTNQLLSQGFSSDSDAYRRAEANQALTKQKAYGDARDSAIQGSTAQAAQDLQNQISRIGVASADRQQPLQDYRSLFGNVAQGAGGAGGASAPGTVDYIGAGENAFQNILNQTNAKNAQSAQTTGTGLAALGTIASIAAAY